MNSSDRWSPTPKADEFHKHLDRCSQCRNQPFNLCPLGSSLAMSALNELKNSSKTR